MCYVKELVSYFKMSVTSHGYRFKRYMRMHYLLLNRMLSVALLRAIHIKNDKSFRKYRHSSPVGSLCKHHSTYLQNNSPQKSDVIFIVYVLCGMLCTFIWWVYFKIMCSFNPFCFGESEFHKLRRKTPLKQNRLLRGKQSCNS